MPKPQNNVRIKKNVNWNPFALKIFLIPVLISFLYLLATNPWDSTRNNILFEDPEAFRLLSLRELLPQAFVIAINWREDAYLNNVRMSIVPMVSSKRNDATFLFNSENTPSRLSITFTETLEGFDVQKDEGENQKFIDDISMRPDKPGLDMEIISLDSIEAFSILHRSGGYEYFSVADEVQTYIILFLEILPVDRVPQWRVLYTTFVNPPTWNFNMNAITNELLEQNIFEEYE